eukprot:2156264-Prorocentrum_lima.AAC.1
MVSQSVRRAASAWHQHKDLLTTRSLTMQYREQLLNRVVWQSMKWTLQFSWGTQQSEDRIDCLQRRYLANMRGEARHPDEPSQTSALPVKP